MEQKPLLDYKKLEIRKVKSADEEITDLIKSTLLGSEGGMRYIMLNTAERIRSYGDSLSFLALYKRNSLKGAIGLCRRITSNRGIRYPSAYLRYLTVQSAFQVEKAPGKAGRRLARAGDSFKQKIFSIFRDHQMATGDDEGKAGPHVLYAYVESRNERSRNIINQVGYEYIRSFLTVAFSRFNPKRHPSVKKLSPEEEPAMAKLLKEFYSGYCFYTDEFSFYDHKYYVLRRNGEIMAGVGAIPARYRVVNVPGVWGWMMMNVLHRTPYFRRLFQPEEFRYIILNAIYCRDGCEGLLPDLFEAVCAEEGYNTALTWLDDHSSLYETLRTNRRMGTLNRLLNAKPGLVYALFTGLDPGETEKFYESPAYISGFDFS